MSSDTDVPVPRTAVPVGIDDPVELAPGDYLSYPGDIPHIYQALVPDSVTVMVMEHV